MTTALDLKFRSDDLERRRSPSRVSTVPSADLSAGACSAERLTPTPPISWDCAFDGIIFVHNEPSGVEVLARGCPNARICLWVQNELFRSYTCRQVRRVLDHAHRVICCSEFIARGVARLVGVSPKLVTVLNGVDTEKFFPANPQPENDPPIILFLGRMVPVKGPDVLVKAAIELKNRGIRFRLRMVGSRNFNAADELTHFERDLRSQASVLGDAVQFLPFQARQEVVGVYQSADILCVPSNWDEPLGLVVGEGMACGLPVVASRRGGIPEVGGQYIAYFDPPQTDELAKRLLHLIRQSTARTSIGKACRSRAVDFLDWTWRYRDLLEAIAFGK